MDLEQAIHQRWAADETLAALLPAASLTTGRPGDANLPYATVNRLRNQALVRTNAGNSLDEATLQINVWHDNYDSGRAIVEQVKVVFDRSNFDLPGGGRVIQMKRAEDSAEHHADGLWQFTILFLVQVDLPSGI